MIEQIILTLAVVAGWAFMTGFLWIFAVAGIESTRSIPRQLYLVRLIFVFSLLATALKAIDMILRIWT